MIIQLRFAFNSVTSYEFAQSPYRKFLLKVFMAAFLMIVGPHLMNLNWRNQIHITRV